MRPLLGVLLVTGLTGQFLAVAGYSPVSNKIGDGCSLSSTLKQEIASYQPIVSKIARSLTEGRHKGKTWKELALFVDTFGSRIAGSDNLERAIDYMLNRSIEYGLDNVHGEPVQVPHWVRGNEEAWLVAPRRYKLNMLGLGGSVGTPSEGITADVVVVTDFDDLKKKAKQVPGKIVVFCEDYISYGKSVKYRQYAAVEASKLGGVASLIRSISPFSINSPHTGWQDYDNNVTKIPTAAITIEDAQMLLRMYNRGTPLKITLKMEAQTLPPVMSRNTVAEVRGSSLAERTILVSGHLDSWDVGNGAMDDGGGAFISWYSLVLLKSLGLQPKRTIRSVLWTSEEEGLVGAFAYAKAHKADEDKFDLLMESDEGTFNPTGLQFSGNQQASCIMKEILKLMAPINATTLEDNSDVGSDIQVWAGHGIPMASLRNDNEKYFWFHHSNGDTMTVEDPDTLDRCTALWAASAYVVADLSVNLPR